MCESYLKHGHDRSWKCIKVCRSVFFKDEPERIKKTKSEITSHLKKIKLIVFLSLKLETDNVMCNVVKGYAPQVFSAPTEILE